MAYLAQTQRATLVVRGMQQRKNKRTDHAGTQTSTEQPALGILELPFSDRACGDMTTNQ